MKVELLKESDLKEIKVLDYKVFKKYLPGERKKSYLEFCFSLLPEACFKAYENGKIIGYIFARNWRVLSWIGTFGVNPDFQNQGVGKKLIKRCISVLQEKQFEIIGLETIPTSARNIGLYIKSGFKSIEPTIIFNKKITDFKVDNQKSKYTQVMEDRPYISHVSKEVISGTDYSPETKENNIVSVLFQDEYCEGFALVRFSSIFAEHKSNELYIKNLLLTDKSEVSLRRFLYSLELLGEERDCEIIKLSANTANEDIEYILTSSGYRVERMATRMIFKGQYDVSDGFDLGRWAM